MQVSKFVAAKVFCYTLLVICDTCASMMLYLVNIHVYSNRHFIHNFDKRRFEVFIKLFNYLY